MYITSTAQGRIEGLELLHSISSVIIISKIELTFTSSFISRYTPTLMSVGDRSVFSSRTTQRGLLLYKILLFSYLKSLLSD
jgi:hypothetical protein